MIKRRNRSLRAGFTMIELMAVLIIMGLLFAVVAGNFMGQTDRARVITTKATLKSTAAAVKRFKMDTGRFPTEDEGLTPLIEQPMDIETWEPYLDILELPVDGWGEVLIYQEYPESGAPFVIISYGADKEQGGEGYDADLYSTDQ